MGELQHDVAERLVRAGVFFGALAKSFFRIRPTNRVRVIVPGGWGLIRASNTQPILVLRWEAQSKEKMAELQRLIEGTVDEVRRELQA